MHKQKEVKIDLKKSKIKMAFAQMESPLPEGKTIGVLPNGRETFVWSNSYEINKRVNKAEEIVSFINQQHPDTELIVFSEYSLPVSQLHVRKLLQELSNKHKIIIIGGGDNIPVRNSKLIYNKCPIFIPNHKEPVWIIKRNVSKWENRYIDEASDRVPQNPVLTWTVNKKKHYLSIHICLDFTFFMKNEFYDTSEPIIRVVPMCSPDINTLRGFADLSLTENGERAVILCNSFGKGSIGKSGIFLVSPDGERLKPAFELEEDIEGITYCEIDCKKLSPPKRTSTQTRNALENIHTYRVETVNNELEILPLRPKPVSSVSRAIINPSLFKHYGKIMRIAFIGVEGYGKLDKDEMSNADFECYSILGQSDMMISHLHQDSNTMLFEINRTVPGSKTFSGNRAQENDDRFPFFEVTNFHKVLGVKVTNQDSRSFDGKSLAPQELKDLLTISKNWNDESVSEQTKSQFVKDGWVLGNTTEKPGDIDAIITIFLNAPDDIDKTLRDFENRVLPKLVEKKQITSIYEGTGTRTSLHYLLRVKSTIKALFAFISEVHSIAAKEKFPILTSTYVIVKKWSSLDLEKSLSRNIPAEIETYIQKEFLPAMDKNDAENLDSLEKEFLQKIVDEHKNLKTSFRFLENRIQHFDKEKIERMNQTLTIGLVKQDMRSLGLVHDELQGRVEELLREVTDEVTDDKYFDGVRNKVNIPKGKSKNVITYAELIKLAMQCVKDKLIEDDMLEFLQNLFAKTKDVRNAIKHSDFGRLKTEDVLIALNQYCTFLIKWDV